MDLYEIRPSSPAGFLDSNDTLTRTLSANINSLLVLPTKRLDGSNLH